MPEFITLKIDVESERQAWDVLRDIFRINRVLPHSILDVLANDEDSTPSWSANGTVWRVHIPDGLIAGNIQQLQQCLRQIPGVSLVTED